MKILAFGLGLALAAATPVRADNANDDCLACHSDSTLERADKRRLLFDEKVFAGSVHGDAGLSCVDCHADVAKAELPHADKLEKVDCSPCHGDQVADYEKSFHAESRRTKGAASKAAWCTDCHGTHEIRQSKEADSATNHFKLPSTCLKCHGNPAIYPAAARIVPGNDPTHFGDSIHGKALLKSGLSVAPNCATCHRYHDIKRPRDPESSVARGHVPGTCGSCHAGILAKFESGVHGEALKRGDSKAPVCVDCHSAHEVKPAETAAWRLSVVQECGTCHEPQIESYHDTYHGQVTELGFTRTAACADCHGAHDIHGKDDPRSTVSAAHRVETCQKCHPGVGASFASYDPHPRPHDKSRSALLHYTEKCMKGLLLFVFTFFGVHTALWMPRSWAERRKSAKKEGADA